ncbi:response regulator transcription factor [Paenibacillus sp.]|uniref:response regulator transcription factor n=1 Tax=Paenibacillus sp. TaxID=58172 RepID=UPI00281D16A4|nr:response regulator transcription factor [Paenibacillus sp.]MDR0270857.1 response regulator transcription factor [Paenibacillus sp.]
MHKRLLAVGNFFKGLGLISLLEEEGYEIIVVQSEHEAMRVINDQHIDMLLLDRSDHSGASLRKITKALHSEQEDKPFPMILFEQHFHKETIIEGLESGANDVVPKTIDAEELLARIRNLLQIFRIENERSNQKVVVGELSIDLGSRIVKRGEQPISLTVKEFDLLLYLARNANHVCTREEILKNVWDSDFDMGTNVIDVYIRHLRTKMDKGFGVKMIQSIRGVGYIIKEGE